jgi:ABC-type sugar transport system substrate-binding protein
LGGAPRAKYKSWVALFDWAEEQKGYALGKALLDAAQQAHACTREGKIQVVGLGGDPSWFGSGLRQAGLVRAVAERPDAELKQVVPTKWTRLEGNQLTRKLLRRFPEATVVWSASDQLGAGAVDALLEAGKTPGKDVFTGGLDLSDVGLELVQQGSFVATSASTLLSYAEAVVLIYDYLHGVDFAAELGDQLEFPALVATRDNVEQQLRLSKCVRSIDFRTFSRVYNKHLKHYDFSLGAYLEATKACTP